MPSAVNELDGSTDQHHLYIYEFITEIYQPKRQWIRNITGIVVPCTPQPPPGNGETENSGSSNKNTV